MVKQEATRCIILHEAVADLCTQASFRYERLPRQNRLLLACMSDLEKLFALPTD